MKINLYTAIAAVLFLGGKNSIRAQAPPAKYVVLVTIDGFRPDFYLDSTYADLARNDEKRSCGTWPEPGFSFGKLPRPYHNGYWRCYLWLGGNI